MQDSAPEPNEHGPSPKAIEGDPGYGQQPSGYGQPQTYGEQPSGYGPPA